MTFIKFPKIRQFRDVIQHVKKQTDFQGLDNDGNTILEHTSAYPTLTFTGSIKLHGTNAGIVIDENNKVHVQSRTREISVLNDNAGFAAFVAGLPQEVIDSFTMRDVAIFGEWCGGNVQKGVAINELPKMFVIFAIKSLIDNEWLDISKYSFPTQLLNSNKVYIINQFPCYSISIDFNNPEIAQEQLAKLTDSVEKECPVGKYFNVSGTGEGIVWCNAEDTSSEYKFKVKGTKHSSSKVKTLAAVDVEKLNSVREFVETTVTVNRLEQGINELKEQGISIERKNTGTYLRWIVTDILSEELDLLTSNEFCAKDVSGAISNAARFFWFNECDSNY